MKITKLPKTCHLALSGGIDSMFGLVFLMSGPPRIESCIHINHGTERANEYEDFCSNICNYYGIRLDVHHYDKNKPMTEDAWHSFRYDIFSSYPKKVIVCHHKDDNLENKLLFGKIMKPENGNIVRPFLQVTKAEIRNRMAGYAYIEDPTNLDENFTKRNKVRRIIQELKDIGCALDSLLQ
jgi:tRNA(Ile)-lysidine synthase TilS/MesJ